MTHPTLLISTALSTATSAAMSVPKSALMSVPLWCLLAFAFWTLLILMFTVGIYRWRRILTERMPPKAFRADVTFDDDWYRRSMRAHANCVENLPVFGAIVLVLSVSGLGGATYDTLSVVIVGARVGQSLVHVGFTETNAMVIARFALFFVQLLAMLTMMIHIARAAL